MVRLAIINGKYLNFLFKFDNRVMLNKDKKRPYIGVIFKIKGLDYYAPLSSPKPKHKKMKNAVDFMRIKGGELGAINFNNMIPVPLCAVEPVNVADAENIQYKMLLINQIQFFDENDTEIINRATKLYKAYRAKKLRKEVVDRCVNFPQLEKKAKLYNPDFKYIPEITKTKIPKLID